MDDNKTKIAATSSVLGKIMVSFFIVVVINGVGLGWVSQRILSGILMKQELQESVVTGILRTQIVSNGISSIFTIIVSLFIAYFLSKNITKPITELRIAVIDIGKGDLNKKISVESDDEISELAASFNQMTKDLKKSRMELEKEYNELERKVEDRTRDLKNKNDDLERFNNMIVGRELRMVELKKKIAKLEKKLSKRQINLPVAVAEN